MDRSKARPTDPLLRKAASLFRVLGDENRLRILYMLEQSEMNVTTLANTLDIEQSALSHQLRALRNARLVKSRIDGRNRMYSLDDEHVRVLLTDVLEHVAEDSHDQFHDEIEDKREE